MKARIAAVAIISTVSSVIVPVAGSQAGMVATASAITVPWEGASSLQSALKTFVADARGSVENALAYYWGDSRPNTQTLTPDRWALYLLPETGEPNSTALGIATGARVTQFSSRGDAAGAREAWKMQSIEYYFQSPEHSSAQVTGLGYSDWDAIQAALFKVSDQNITEEEVAQIKADVKKFVDDYNQQDFIPQAAKDKMSAALSKVLNVDPVKDGYKSRIQNLEHLTAEQKAKAQAAVDGAANTAATAAANDAAANTAATAAANDAAYRLNDALGSLKQEVAKEASVKSSGDYTNATNQSVYDQALVAANAELVNPDATAESVAAALKALQDAAEALNGDETLAAAKSGLEKAIAAAEAVKASDKYTYDDAADQAGLDEALAAAKDALNSDDQAVVDAAKTGLDAATKAIDGVAPVTPSTGSEGTGSEGTGSEGAGSEGSNPGTGSEGAGSEGSNPGAGSEGTGSEGTGSEGAGSEGSNPGTGSEGSNPGSGSESTGSEGTGSEGTGSEGTGSEGAGSEGSNPGAGSEGTGSEGTGSEGAGSEGSNPGTGSEGSNPGSGSESTGSEGTGSEGKGAGTVNPGTDAEDAALETAKEEGKEAIDGLENLSDTEKDGFKAQVDAANSVDAVDAVVDTAKAQDAKNKDAAADAALETAKDAANGVIDGLPNLSDAEKEGFKAQVEAATSPEAVKTVADAAKAKDAANKAAAEAAAALEAAKDAAKETIDGLPNLSAAEKEGFKAQVDAATTPDAVKAVVAAAEAKDAANQAAAVAPGTGAEGNTNNNGGGAQQGGEGAINTSEGNNTANESTSGTNTVETNNTVTKETVTEKDSGSSEGSWWKWLLALIPAVLGLIGIGSYVVYVNQVDGGDRAPLQRGQANPADYIRWIQNLPARTDGGL